MWPCIISAEGILIDCKEPVMIRPWLGNSLLFQHDTNLGVEESLESGKQFVINEGTVCMVMALF